jgi:protein-tyrosine phosphatase
MSDHAFAPAGPDEAIVHGACAPGWDVAATSADPVEDWLAFVTGRGVERVCCLLSERQLRGFDDLLARYQDTFGRDRVAHVPMADHRLTTPETLRSAVLPVLRTAEGRGEPLVVHCLAGIGRTGQVLAAWLVHARGYDPAAAVETVRRTGRDPAEAVEAGHADRSDLDALLAAVA